MLNWLLWFHTGLLQVTPLMLPVNPRRWQRRCHLHVGLYQLWVPGLVVSSGGIRAHPEPLRSPGEALIPQVCSERTNLFNGQGSAVTENSLVFGLPSHQLQSKVNTHALSSSDGGHLRCALAGQDQGKVGLSEWPRHPTCFPLSPTVSPGHVSSW